MRTKTKQKERLKMAPKMSDINVAKSRYYKVADLVEATGQPWAKAQLPVVIESAEISEYPAGDNGIAEDAFLIYFKNHVKPLGCNLTIRKVLQGIVGNVEWDTENLAGVPLVLYAESTSMGEGVRVRYNQPTSKSGGDPVHDDAPPPSDDDNIPF